MATILINSESIQAQELLNFISTLPFATVVEEKKKGFAEAAAECNAISVKEFTNELRARIEKWSDDDA